MNPWTIVLALMTLMGCSRGDLIATPSSIDFGEIDFQQDKPTSGYNPLEVTLSNEGSKALDIQVNGIDSERMLLGAQLEIDDPPILRTVESGQQTISPLSIWGYNDGERNTEVTGSFSMNADGLKDSLKLDWSYTPVRNFVDTGM